MQQPLELTETEAAGHVPDVAAGGDPIGVIQPLPRTVNRSWGGQWQRYEPGFTFEGFSPRDIENQRFLNESRGLNAPPPPFLWP